MNRTRPSVEVHAVLMGTVANPDEFDDQSAGRPIERRLNRIERVVSAYRGKVIEREPMLLRISFISADAAVLAACEMQQRCADLPQVSANRLALRIGIHQGMVRQRVKDGSGNVQEIATRLALIDDNVIISGEVFESLNNELRKITKDFNAPSADIAARQVNWRSEIPSSAFGGESLWPDKVHSNLPGTTLLLHSGLKTISLTLGHPVITIGRDAGNDLVLVDNRTSRNHCRIERNAGQIVLIDTSTNGTCILTDAGEESLIRNTSAPLQGTGLIFFGRKCNGERRGGVRYETS